MHDLPFTTPAKKMLRDFKVSIIYVIG